MKKQFGAKPLDEDEKHVLKTAPKVCSRLGVVLQLFRDTYVSKGVPERKCIVRDASPERHMYHDVKYIPL